MIDPAAPAPVGNMGQPIPRYDARAKVTGKALYAADMALPDVAYVFSPGICWSGLSLNL